MATGKAEEKKREERLRHKLYRAAKKQGEATQQPSHASAMLKIAMRAIGSHRKVADGEVSFAVTVLGNYRIATRFKSQITPNFLW